MSDIKSYRDLFIWQKSMSLVTEIYSITKNFPVAEQYGLSNQMRRCAVSIPSNIAEGYGRNSTGDYKRFLKISVGSLFELQTQIEIAFNLTYITDTKFKGVIDLCGAIADTVWIMPGDPILVGVHGTGDKTVACYFDSIFALTHPESLLFGGGDILNRLDHVSVPHSLYLF